jgi:DNA-binding IclR family transcriptional regulator
MNWIVPGCPAVTFFTSLTPAPGQGQVRHTLLARPALYQEAMPIRSRYQGGAYSPVQHHEVVAGQGRAVAGERGGMRAAVVAPGPLPMTRTS